MDLDGFRAFARPGFVRIATSFELEALGEGTRLSTETRVQPTDAAAACAFRLYWWAIRGGSGLIRRDVMHAVRRRAERDRTSRPNGDEVAHWLPSIRSAARPPGRPLTTAIA